MPNAFKTNTPFSNAYNMANKRHFGNPISGNSRRGPQLSPGDKRVLKAHVDDGLSYREIQEITGVAPSTTASAIKSLDNDTTGKARPRSGRPGALSERDQQLILRLVRQHPKWQYQKLLEEAGVGQSHSTIYRLLKHHGITNWRAKRRPELTQA